MDWSNLTEKISPFVVKIETGYARGTGFFCRSFGESILIVTAKHVIDEAVGNNKPLCIIKEGWPMPLVLSKKDSTVVFSPLLGSDAAIIFIEGHVRLPFPSGDIPLISWDKPLAAGEEVAWAGFPGLESLTDRPLCIFTGVVSGSSSTQPLIGLIDGTGIHGVSGGPIFRRSSNGKISIVGVVSACLPHFFKALRPVIKRRKGKRPNKNRKSENREIVWREAEFSTPGLMQTESLYGFAAIIATYENALEAAAKAVEGVDNGKAGRRLAINQGDAG